VLRHVIEREVFMQGDIRLVTIMLSGAAIVFACNKENQPGPADPTGSRNGNDSSAQQSPAAETRSAATSLTQSRCSREQRCNNVGAGKKYSSFADCEATVGNDWRDDLNARECSGGVDQHELDECMTAIRNEDCSNPLDSLERIAQCTQAQICED
jgi:hypothetical protein